MSLEILLGEGTRKLKLPDGRELLMRPLTLREIVELQQKVGIHAQDWASKEAQAKLTDIGVVAFFVWMAIRKDPAAKGIAEEQFLELFGLGDVPVLTDAFLHVLELSGISAKKVPADAEPATAPAAAATSTPGSGLS